jgi:Glycosyl transferases group 1
MRTASTLRLGLADAADPRDMKAGSGVTGSLMRALESLVAEVVPFNGGMPRLIELSARLAGTVPKLRPADLRDLRAAVTRLHFAAQLGGPTVCARLLMLRRRMASAGPLDAMVLRGSEMQLPAGPPVATFDDSTVLQARESYPWPHLQGLSEGDFRRWAARQRSAYVGAVACCCATQWVAESIVGDYGIPRERVFTIGFGQNHETREPAPRDWSTPRYLFVGADWPRKNGDAVLAAFARVREQIPDARLDLVGGHPRIDQAGVHAHGPLSLVSQADRETLAGLYAEATAFVMPSLHEPAGIVYVEAGGSGVPSIGTSNGGAATMIGPGGLVVDPLDGEAIIAAMLQLANPETAQRLGALARSHSRLFTWRLVAERLVRALAPPGVDVSGLADFL